MTILLIEDVVDTAEVICVALAEHAITVATNESDAFRHLVAAKFSLIMLDLSVVVNERKGFAALVESAAIPLIICSGTPAQFHPPEFAGIASHFIHKPFEIEHLLAAVVFYRAGENTEISTQN